MEQLGGDVDAVVALRRANGAEMHVADAEVLQQRQCSSEACFTIKQDAREQPDGG